MIEKINQMSKILVVFEQFDLSAKFPLNECFQYGDICCTFYECQIIWVGIILLVTIFNPWIVRSASVNLHFVSSIVGGWSGPNPHFYKSVGKGFFLALFAQFCLFLLFTFFDRKISGNFPHFRWRKGGCGSGRFGKNPHFLFLFEGFP